MRVTLEHLRTIIREEISSDEEPRLISEGSPDWDVSSLLSVAADVFSQSDPQKLSVLLDRCEDLALERSVERVKDLRDNSEVREILDSIRSRGLQESRSLFEQSAEGLPLSKITVEDLIEKGIITESEKDTLVRHISDACATGIIEGCESAVGQTMPPTLKEFLKARIIGNGVKMFTFGVIDNGVLVIAGEAIDVAFGAMFKSSMVAAGLGNALSDGVGEVVGGSVESALVDMGLDPAAVTDDQMQLAPAWWGTAESSVGVISVVAGCLVGMAPILLLGKLTAGAAVVKAGAKTVAQRLGSVVLGGAAAPLTAVLFGLGVGGGFGLLGWTAYKNWRRRRDVTKNSVENSFKVVLIDSDLMDEPSLQRMFATHEKFQETDSGDRPSAIRRQSVEDIKWLGDNIDRDEWMKEMDPLHIAGGWAVDPETKKRRLGNPDINFGETVKLVDKLSRSLGLPNPAERYTTRAAAVQERFTRHHLRSIIREEIRSLVEKNYVNEDRRTRK